MLYFYYPSGQVFPWDIDISGVARLLLLTPFLHCHGIYVFFLRVSFPPPLPPFFSPLPRSTSPASFSLALSFVFSGLLISRISSIFLCVLGLASLSFVDPPLPPRFPPRWEGIQSIARIPTFAEIQRLSNVVINGDIFFFFLANHDPFIEHENFLVIMRKCGRCGLILIIDLSNNDFH